MSEKEERKKIDADLKKEILDAHKEQPGQMDVSERAKMLEGKIPTKPKEKKEE